MKTPTRSPLLASLALLIAAAGLASAQITVTNWTGGAADTRFDRPANWDNGVPTSGVTGNVGGAVEVTVNNNTHMVTDTTINMNDSSTLRRLSSTGNIQWSNILNFNGSSSLITSELQQNPGTTLNWNSSGTFTSAGAKASPNFTATGGTANMSAGTWYLTGNSHATDAYNARGDHVFNLTGGTMVLDKRMRIGAGDPATPAAFNLGADAALYVGELFLDAAGSVFNFAPGATLHAADSSTFGTRVSGGYISISGIVTTNINDFIIGDTVTQNFGFGDVTYTPITAVPEPGALALGAGFAALGLLLWRRRAR